MAVTYLRRLYAGFPPRRPGVEPRPGHVGFVVDKVALGQVFSEYFDFSCQFSFHSLLHTHHHLSSRAGTTGQLVADVQSGLSLNPPEETKKLAYFDDYGTSFPTVGIGYSDDCKNVTARKMKQFILLQLPRIRRFGLRRRRIQSETESLDILNGKRPTATPLPTQDNIAEARSSEKN
jgi:hypothetical protein